MECFESGLIIQVSDQPVELSSGKTVLMGAPRPAARMAMTCQVVPITESPVVKVWTSLR